MQLSLFDFQTNTVENQKKVNYSDNIFSPFTKKKFRDFFGEDAVRLRIFFYTLKTNDSVVFDFSHMSNHWCLKNKHKKHGIIKGFNNALNGIDVLFENDNKPEFISNIKSICLLNGKTIKN